MADIETSGSPATDPAAGAVTDLDSALDRAFSEIEERDAETGGDDAGAKDRGARDPKSGKFTSKAAPAKADAATDKDPKAKPDAPVDPASKDKPDGTDPTKPAADAQAGPAEPPAHWSEADKATFKAADPKLQSWLLDRHKQMEGDYTRKLEPVAKERKSHEALKEFVKPIWPTIQEMETTGVKLGFTVPQAMQSLWQTFMNLQKDPTATIGALAKQYKADLSKLTGQPAAAAAGDGDTYTDPQLKQLQDRYETKIADLEGRLSKLSGTVETRSKAEQADIQSKANQETAEMQAAVDANGQPKFPHFAEVRERMGQLFAQGFPGNLAEAYDEACYLVPTVRQKLIDAQFTAREATAEADRKAKAAAAEKARKDALSNARKAGAATVRSSPAGNGQARAKSLDDALDAAAEELGIG